MIPTWLHDLSLAAIALGLACALVVLIDVVRNPPQMAVMRVVWPVTALFGTVLALWLYWRFGRADAGKAPFWASVATGAGHCGAGCTLGDICAEFLCLLAPAVAVAFGWHWLFPEKMFAVWVVDFLFAYAFGVAFQYFAIKPMRDVSVREAIWLAIKADTLSLTAWQVGMYGFMAWASFALFRPAFSVALTADRPEFWFMMQIAMLCGFATSYPVNWWLIRSGVKERM